MLRFLRIRHLATIDSVEVEFGQGLNVLTGETGAGKSILVEAVSLLLGGRASGDVVRTGEELAAVEAVFEEAGKDILIRREVTSQGRSRAFVDGTLVTASALKELAAGLVELHGQHEHQTLIDPDTHLVLLDAFGAFDPFLRATAAAFDQWRSAVDQLSRLRKAVAERASRQELVEFQLGELERAGLQPGEDEALQETRQILASAERVERLCAESYEALYDRDDAVLAGLGGIWRRVADLASIDRRFQPYVDAREGIKTQLEDLALFLRRYADGIEASPARLQQVEERLALIERLKRKYGPALSDAIGRRDALRQELTDFEHGDEQMGEVEQRTNAARAAYLEAAGRLSVERRRTALAFERELERQLAELAMERTRFEMRFQAEPLLEERWTSRGVDTAECYISPNIGEELRPLARIASGGELSRVMLAIKTMTAASRDKAAGGLIFDEVDAGIGGRVADVVGRKLRALGATFQVCCITHLPQIAASADTHFRIEKRVDAGRTRTTVTRLDDAGRVEEVSRMLGGAQLTDAIRASAREMLADRQRTRDGDISPTPGVPSAEISPSLFPDQGERRKAKGERAKAKPDPDDNRPQRPSRSQR